jgi:anthranilate phosphoribosyltransferase
MTSDMLELKTLIGRVAAGERLSEDDAAIAFDAMMSGNATPAQMGGFLMALRVRGETVDEITGAARTMRAKALRIDAPPDAFDTAGTGGDGSGTFNISTATAIVLAGAGIPMAKHGNRNLSSHCGSADVLAALGVNIDADMTLVRRSLWEAGICFLMAPRHHSAMRHVGPTRVELGTRTIFNLLGPLSNPAGAERQLVGVFAPQWVKPMAEVLGKLGSKRAWVVHGSGLDELTTTGSSQVAALENGTVTTFELTPEELGLKRASLADLKGGDPAGNAETMRALLRGAAGPIRDIVLLNTAAALHVAGKAADLRAGMTLAAETIDSGAASRALDRMIEITNAPPPAAKEAP